MQGTIEPIKFGTFIAYLLPGFIAFYSGTYVSTTLQKILETVLTKDGQIGGAFLILIISLTAGVTISIIRALILDSIQKIIFKIKPISGYSALSDPEIRAAFDSTIEDVYRFAQFAGNLFSSLIILIFLGYCIGPLTISSNPWHFTMVLIIAVIVFIYYGIQLRSSHDSINEILNSKKGG